MTDTERLRRQDEADFAEVMRTAAGMRFLSCLVEASGAYGQSYYVERGDVNGALFAEGRRSLGLELLARVHGRGSDEAEYFRAVTERNELRRRDARDLAAAEAEWRGDGFDGHTG